MILQAFSKAIYSSWYYYLPDNILFDCGEGALLNLGPRVFGIDKIVLSHSHMDHIAGLFQLICYRQSGMGDKDKPLEIYYPKNDKNILVVINAIDQMLGSYIKYKLDWIPVDYGDVINLANGRKLNIFKAEHNPGIKAFGFVITETRNRLKKEFSGLNGTELAKLPDEEKKESFSAAIFGYSGDGLPVKNDLYSNIDILIHDCTFINTDDVKYELHSTLHDVINLAKEQSVKKLILSHLSPRYSDEKRIGAVINQAVKVMNFKGKIDWVRFDKVNDF